MRKMCGLEASYRCDPLYVIMMPTNIFEAKDYAHPYDFLHSAQYQRYLTLSDSVCNIKVPVLHDLQYSTMHVPCSFENMLIAHIAMMQRPGHLLLTSRNLWPFIKPINSEVTAKMARHPRTPGDKASQSDFKLRRGKADCKRPLPLRSRDRFLLWNHNLLSVRLGSTRMFSISALSCDYRSEQQRDQKEEGF